MIVYTYGVFDLLHYGHIRALKNARNLGDYLIIGVFTDKVAKGFKRQPILNEVERFNAIRELNIGCVTLQDEFLPSQEFLNNLGINIVAKAEGAGWDRGQVPKWKKIKSILLPYTSGISSSEIIKRCQQSSPII